MIPLRLIKGSKPMESAMRLSSFGSIEKIPEFAGLMKAQRSLSANTCGGVKSVASRHL